MAETIGRRAGTKTRAELYEESRASASRQSFFPRVMRRVQALLFAAVMAALSAIALGLVDTGREIDSMLASFDYDVASLSRAASATLAQREPADRMTAPRSRLRRTLDTFPENTDRIIRVKTPLYCGPVAKVFATLINLVPDPTVLDAAFREYLEQIAQASADRAPTAAARELRDRLLDLKYEALVNRISSARERTREGVSHALTALQVITLASVAIAAFMLGF